MAKPYLSRADNDMLKHVSLLDGLSRNVFDGGAAIASDTLLHAIGGVLEVIPESMAFLAPNVHSYRRYMPDIFVPTQRSWGFENLSVALPLPAGVSDAMHIQPTFAGADAPPYLARAPLLCRRHDRN